VSLPFDVTPKLIARFWAKVDKHGPVHRNGLGECWLWTAACTPKGYGVFFAHGANVTAHRTSFILTHARLPVGGEVRHRCDVRRCVRPEHLDGGTALSNVSDRVLRKRSAKGERNGSAKLTAEQVDAIRERVILGESQGKLAKEFGVSQPLISGIILGKKWGS
jgi:hypothetical protein